MGQSLRIAIAFVCGLALLPLAVLASGLVGWLGADARSQPPRIEERVGQAFLKASLARQAAALHNPVRADDEAELSAGMGLYRDNCLGCHGDFGKPSAWGSKGFYPRVPQFADHPPDLTAEEMYVAVKSGVRYSGMGAWKDMMSDQDIWRVVTFLHELKRLPPKVDREWKAKH
jgi:mono/diheme cytochrome c family protein